MKFSTSTKIRMPKPKMPKIPSMGVKTIKVKGVINPFKITR